MVATLVCASLAAGAGEAAGSGVASDGSAALPALSAMALVSVVEAGPLSMEAAGAGAGVFSAATGAAACCASGLPDTEPVTSGLVLSDFSGSDLVASDLAASALA